MTIKIKTYYKVKFQDGSIKKYREDDPKFERVLEAYNKREITCFWWVVPPTAGQEILSHLICIYKIIKLRVFLCLSPCAGAK